MSPSPVAHSAMGYLIYKLAKRDIPYPLRKHSASGLKLLLATVFLSLLPDLDVLPGIVFGDMMRFHNQWTHSLITGLGVALAAGLAGRLRGSNIKFWFLAALLAYEFHVIMDYFTVGSRGIMLFWPLSVDRFQSSFKLFTGVRWSEGLFSPVHIVNLATELVFVGLVVLAGYFIEKKKI